MTLQDTPRKNAGSLKEILLKITKNKLNKSQDESTLKETK